MIYLDSRYANGHIFKAYNTVKDSYEQTVFRVFPEKASEIYYYQWKDGDRIDLVSTKLFGGPEYWWQIMDFNPEIINPMFIDPGTQLRIPSVS
jgi:hypothetical protein